MNIKLTTTHKVILEEYFLNESYMLQLKILLVYLFIPFV